MEKPRMPRFSIGCLGRARHGKGTLADILVRYYDQAGYKVQQVSFADPLKDFLTLLVGSDKPFRGTDDERNAPLTHFRWSDFAPYIADALHKFKHPTGRELMQIFGTDVIRNRFLSDSWIRIAQNTTAAFDGVTVFDDVRFLNEVNSVDYCFKVVRDGVPHLNHDSEAQIDLVPLDDLVQTFANNSFVDDLEQTVVSYLQANPLHLRSSLARK